MIPNNSHIVLFEFHCNSLPYLGFSQLLHKLGSCVEIVISVMAWKRRVAGTLCIHSMYSHVLPYVKECERNAERMLPVVREKVYSMTNGH